MSVPHSVCVGGGVKAGRGLGGQLLMQEAHCGQQTGRGAQEFTALSIDNLCRLPGASFAQQQQQHNCAEIVAVRSMCVCVCVCLTPPVAGCGWPVCLPACLCADWLLSRLMC